MLVYLSVLQILGLAGLCVLFALGTTHAFVSPSLATTPGETSTCWIIQSICIARRSQTTIWTSHCTLAHTHRCIQSLCLSVCLCCLSRPPSSLPPSPFVPPSLSPSLLSLDLSLSSISRSLGLFKLNTMYSKVYSKVVLEPCARSVFKYVFRLSPDSHNKKRKQVS
jgi:hypothetical protein